MEEKEDNMMRIKVNRACHSRMTMILLFILTGMLTTTIANAQKKEFTLEDLNYGGTRYFQMIPENRYTTWWGDVLVNLDALGCASVDPKTGKETKLFSTEDINAWAGLTDSLRIYHMYYAEFPYPNEPLVLVQNQQERMLINFKDGTVAWRQSCQDEQNEEWVKESRAVAFVKDNQLHVTTADGNTRQLTTDGSREIVYGQSVHRDEFGIEKGTFWSPDGKRLAFYRMDQSMVTDYPQVNIDTRIATCEPDKYPMAGETSHKVTVGVYDIEKGTITYMNTCDPTDMYFTNIAWSPDSRKLYIQELNRDQNDCRLQCYDATTGENIGQLYRETDEKYVEPLHPIAFLPWDDSKFIMQSQKDGYNHLYLCTINKTPTDITVKQLTSGTWVVLDVLGFDTKGKAVIISSNECNPIQANTYSVEVATGKRQLLDNGRGWHNATLSGCGNFIVDNYSEPDVPRKIDIYDIRKKKTFNWLTAANPWAEYNAPEFSCGTIKAADGITDLYYRMVKPVDFDPAKKYPTVVYVYGGPHAHNVHASWHYYSRGWETYMAQKGYLLFILDNRGSEHRGKEFEQATFRQLGQIETQDQMKGIEYLKSLPYVDTDRIGVHGWSFGGFMTITMMTTHPEVFKVGVAGGPVIDWKWYEVMYGERYMDTPQTNPEGYEKTSLINKAADLAGKLQIITGYNDKTVVPQHCLSFIEACIEAGTHPDFFVYPGEPHNMRGHQSVHLHERITQYFEDYLK